MEAIVAVYADWGIGAAGTQQIVIPEDRKRFKELTEGAAIVVGRKTLEERHKRELRRHRQGTPAGGNRAARRRRQCRERAKGTGVP